MRHKFKLLMFAVSLLIIPSLSGCSAPVLEGESVDYNIMVMSKGNKRLSGVEVKFYVGRHLITSGVTSGSGVVNINAVAHDYTVKFDNLPKGIKAKENYKVNADKKSYSFKLDSELIKEMMPEDITYSKGDIVYNFEVTDTDGKKFNFSKELQKYEAYVFSFFYVDCGYCQLEMPDIKRALNGLEDKIGYLALDVMPSDTDAYIETMKEALDWDFRAASCKGTTLSSAFKVRGAPTVVIITRDGLFAEFIEGYQGSLFDWTGLFMSYAL